jgi:hypothetical protein
MAAIVLRAIGVAVGAGLFLALAGAFGSQNAPLPFRIAYWTGLLLTGTLLGISLRIGLRTWSPLTGRTWMQVALATLALDLVMTPLVWGVVSLMFRPRWTGDSLAYLAVAVFVVCTAMNLLNLMIERRPQETHAPAPGAIDAAATPPSARLLDRLPPKLRGAELYAVQAEDHYLRLHTSRGEDLILMRLGDAITELDGLEDARTHRSWWVAKAAVREARRTDGRTVLVLPSGAKAPVSRTYVAALKSEGWF